MTSSAVESVLDVALWFQGRARYENEHLQAQKHHLVELNKLAMEEKVGQWR